VESRCGDDHHGAGARALMDLPNYPDPLKLSCRPQVEPTVRLSVAPRRLAQFPSPSPGETHSTTRPAAGNGAGSFCAS
jgi:hypothetical protein